MGPGTGDGSYRPIRRPSNSRRVSHSPVSSGFDRSQRLSISSSKPPPLSNGIKSPDATRNGILHHPKSLKQYSSTLLEIPAVQAGAPPVSNRTPSRSPSEKNEYNLPTILTEGPSPTSTFSYSGRGTIKEARNKRRKPWRKLMWVKQNYPDNYTDATFLETLQRNVNFRAYDFWPLVYDTTVIIQHISTVVIFVCAFVAISVGKVQPGYVAGASTILTISGWLVWDDWNEEEQNFLTKAQEAVSSVSRRESSGEEEDLARSRKLKPPNPGEAEEAQNLLDPRAQERKTLAVRSASLSPKKSSRASNIRPGVSSTLALTPSATTLDIVKPNSKPGEPLARSLTAPAYPLSTNTPMRPPSPPPPPSRANRRLSTLKSALLIYSTLLGLSPILKSLTRTTTSDSIWALSSWLFLVNLLCFDYGLSEGDTEVKRGVDGGVQLPHGGLGPPGVGNSLRRKLPTSLSTTTALAASVVLASRLTETADVFSLLLFSIQIFGLFPLFRRRLRHLSSVLHVSLTSALVLFAGASLHYVVNWQWSLMWFGMVLGGGGGAAWVLMGMQRYKNEIRGPWDPARPVFSRRQWAD
ncbi:hypothetical protein TWF106_003213 [Orbilia oligospora]|uniref:Phosphatidylinositol N-acetylglucosaminyltransferase subunit C n=1 Tax=Orbilia oligospora TaxID=2813651 RepID=A0A7C8Q177_ORBOL|nr:hypothetical protein TWF788_000357 [Orbilia oligospora]KAF3200498.1 hypothetical protein TWF106_003213 [Orbilia oligospora]